MSTSAFLLMTIVQGTVVVVTVYFFLKVLRSPMQEEPDSFSENDETPR
jgi:heme/copper-type cytochrome/quinol oxidase subunit 2